MNDLDRELEELTGAATRYVVAPPASAIRHRAAVRRRARAATATASALAIAGAVTAVFVLGPRNDATNLTPVQSATPTPTTAGSVTSNPAAIPTPTVVALGPSASTTPDPLATPTAESLLPPSPLPAIASFPPRVTSSLTHGGKYWAVILVVSKDPEDPRHAEAAQALAAVYAVSAGPPVPAGELSCDLGAFEGLVAAGVALDPAVRYSSTAVYFDTKADAEAFVAAFEPGVVGTVLVKTYCLD